MEAVKVKARIGSDAKLELLEPIPQLPRGDVELILIFTRNIARPIKPLSPAQWPVLHGGRYLGGTLRRSEIYSDDGR